MPLRNLGSNRLRPANLSRALASAITRLANHRTPGQSFVFVEPIGGTPFYVQFRVDEAILRFEAVSNRYLPDGLKLNEGQHALLRGLGWLPPDGESPNWQRMELVDRAFDFAAVARLVQRTFSEAYGVSPESLRLRCTWDADGPPWQGLYGVSRRTIIDLGWKWSGAGTGQSFGWPS